MALIERADLRQRNVTILEDSLNPRLHQAIITLHDQHYLDDQGLFQPVDESIADGTVSGFVHKCEKTRHALHIGATGERRWIPRRAMPNEYVGFGRLQSFNGTTWANVNLGTPVRSGNTIIWNTANFTLKLTNIWRKIKLEAVLKTETSRRRLRWAVTLNGLTYNQGNLTSVSDGQVVGFIEKPIAWDANGSIKNQNVQITTTYLNGFIEFGGDLSTAVLPITIDPTFVDGPSGDVSSYIDALLYEPSPTTNYGTFTGLEIGTEPAGPNKRERYIFKFDVSSLAGKTVTSATLRLTTSAVGASVVNTPEINFYSILSGNSDWVESECSWNNRKTATAWAGSAGCGTQGTDYSNTLLGTGTSFPTAGSTGKDIDLLISEVQAWVGGANYGLLAKESTEPNTEKRILDYCSSDHADTANRPKLTVVYADAPFVDYIYGMLTEKRRFTT